MSRPIEHLEYIRMKYLDGKDQKKSKSKKGKKVTDTKAASNVKIFDDDIGLKDVKMDPEDDELYYSVKEEQPVVINAPAFSSSNWVSDEPVKEEKMKSKEESVKSKKFKVQSIHRNKETGQIRDFKKEAEEKEIKDREKMKEEKKFQELSAGLKQTKEAKEKIESDLYEMNKPFARYEDDEDRDKLLKEKELLDDPMLDYMRKKKAKKEKELALKEGKEYKPKLNYRGPTAAPLNRFNIDPGHRWDGVDRSNGFEKRYFDMITSKEAIKEEAYRWATEDM